MDDTLVQVEEVTRTFPLDHSEVTALDHSNLRVSAGEFLDCRAKRQRQIDAP